MVTAGLERFREAAEETPAVVVDRAGLAVDEPAGLPDLSAEGLDDHLVAEAHAQCGNRWREPPDDLQAGTGGGRPARARGDHEVRRLELLGLVRADRVVSAHQDLRAELSEEMREVVRERVVVVDQEDHARASARSIAVSSAASFRRHSSCSAAGSESATIPAPA